MEMKLRGIVLGQDEPCDVVILNGKVVSRRSAAGGGVDAGSRTSIIAPTLFDIQVNGFGGVDLQGPRMLPEDVGKINDKLAAHGVSHWVPTIITGPLKRMESACRAIVEAMKDRRIARAVHGIHIEGPWISPLDGPRGAHAKQYVRKPDLREFDRLLDAADGKVLYVTIAPEIDGAVAFIKALRRRGVHVALGHHHATAEQIARAVDAGARLCTHLGNGLASTLHRHLNPLWPQLADDRLTAALIADLEHLPPPVLKTFVRAKRPENIILASDCVHLAGLKPGSYELGGIAVQKMSSGRICLSGTDLLAGSSLELLQGVVNAARVTDMTLEQAFASATSIPARLLGLRHHFRAPTVGAHANLILFDIEKTRNDKWKAVVRCVFIDGERKA